MVHNVGGKAVQCRRHSTQLLRHTRSEDLRKLLVSGSLVCAQQAAALHGERELAGAPVRVSLRTTKKPATHQFVRRLASGGVTHAQKRGYITNCVGVGEGYQFEEFQPGEGEPSVCCIEKQ